MTRLVLPDLARRATWAAAVAEFDGVPAMAGSGLWSLSADAPLDTTEAGCRRVVAMLTALADPEAVQPDGMVPCDHYWITDGDPGVPADSAEEQVVGFLALRHRLNAYLLEEGGHVGYSVRPSRRREGHATRALAQAVRRAAALGIDRLLVTCDLDNRPSAAVIEANGGVLEDRRLGKLRYWITTPTADPAQTHGC